MRAKRRIVAAPDHALVRVSRSNDAIAASCAGSRPSWSAARRSRTASSERPSWYARSPARASRSARSRGSAVSPAARSSAANATSRSPRNLARSAAASRADGDLLVRSLCGRRPVPDRPVRIAGQRPGERGVGQPALLAGCRLIDSRPDQRVPEPESALIERSEAGRGGRRPVVDVEPCSEELFGRAIQFGELAVIECRKQHQRSHVGVESGQPRRKRRLEPSRQRQRLPRPGQLEIDRCAGARSGPADCRPPPRGSAP